MSPNFQIPWVAKNLWRKINTITPIRFYKYAQIFVFGLNLFLKAPSFPRKTVRTSDKITSIHEQITELNPSIVFARVRLVFTRHVTEYAPAKISDWCSPIFKPARVAKNIWRMINTIAFIWRENKLGYLFLDNIFSSKLTVFLGLRSRLLGTDVRGQQWYLKIFLP